jgi:hypothetical protein
MWYLNLEEIFISRHILHQHRYNCPIALPVRRNPQHRSFLTVVSATSALPFQTLRHQWNVCHPVVKYFTRQTLPTINRKHFFMKILCIESFCPQKRTTEHCSSVVIAQVLSPFWLLNQPLNFSMHVCYLDCHEAGLCCYLDIHTENLLHPLELFYFHLWPIYWLSFVWMMKENCGSKRLWSTLRNCARIRHYTKPDRQCRRMYYYCKCNMILGSWFSLIEMESDGTPMKIRRTIDP